MAAWNAIERRAIALEIRSKGTTIAGSARPGGVPIAIDTPVELARFVPGVDVKLFLSARGDEKLPLHRRLASLKLGIDDDDELPGRAGRTLALEREAGDQRVDDLRTAAGVVRHLVTFARQP